MRVNPYHVYDGLKSRTRIPATEFERALFVLLHGPKALNATTPLRPWEEGCVVDPSIEYPYQVFQIPECRTILESFLLATNNDFEIHEALHMPVEEVGIYRELFFDTTLFKTELELIIFLRTVPDQEENKKLYRVAFHQGLGALRWNLCRDKGTINPEDVIRTVMTDTFYRSLEHRGVALTHKLAKEASNYARISLECARTLVKDRNPGDSDIEDLRIKFEEAKQNRTVHELKAEMGGEEVMH